jgi:hypothetical protein
MNGPLRLVHCGFQPEAGDMAMTKPHAPRNPGVFCAPRRRARPGGALAANPALG